MTDSWPIAPLRQVFYYLMLTYRHFTLYSFV